MNKTIEKIKSILYRSSTFTNPHSLTMMATSLPYVIMPVAEDGSDAEGLWVLNRDGNVLGEQHNKVRDADMVHPLDLDLSSLTKQDDGNYYLWSTITPDRMRSAMMAYRNLLGKIVKADTVTMRGNKGTPRQVCFGGSR